MTPQQTRDLIGFVINLWPTVPYRNDALAPMVKSWHLILSDIDASEATALLVDLSRAGQEFPPTPGLIAKTVLDLRDELAGTRAPDADQAWAEIQRGIGSHGFVNGQPVWSHPAVADVVAALTWRELCMSTNHDTMRAHFLRLYDTAAKRTVDRSRSVTRRALDSPTRLGELPSA
jgi:hypothetical protein